MILKGLDVGCNCYVLGCEETKEGIVIDPGAGASHILRIIQAENLQIKYIINTHGHVDHIGANAAIQQATGAEILIHEDDSKMLTSAAANFSMFMGHPVTSPAAARFLNDGDKLQAGSIELEVIHTPGHSPGGICLKTDGIIFSGDTLFCTSIGRTDFPGGSYNTLIKSINERLMCFDDETIVYPGHMEPTSIGFERTNNPFL